MPASVFGPGTALRSTFGRLGWTISPDGVFRGPGHVRFHVRFSSPKQISAAIEAGWGGQVQGVCSDRVGLQSIGVPDRGVTQSIFKGLRAWEQAIVARHVTGAFMSNAEKSTWSRVVEEHCPLCGQRDTKGHRIFDCPALQHVRNDHTDLLAEVARSFPSWVHLLAADEHEDVMILRLITATRKLPPPLAPPLGFRHLHLFTDGSGFHSNIPAARLTFWAVVWCPAVQSREDVDLWFRLDPPSKVASFRVIAQGSTPGLQTVPRSEMAALVWAARWGLQHPNTEVTVYTDAQSTFDAVQAIQQGRRTEGSGPSSDIEVLLPEDSLARLHVEKVKAHTEQAWTGLLTPEQQWLCLGNEAADQAAKAARGLEHQAVLQYSDNIAEHVKFQETHMVAFARYLVQINVADARLRESCVEPTAAAHGADEIQALVRDIWEEWTQWDPQPFWTADIHDGSFDQADETGPLHEYEVCLLRWLRELHWPVRPAPVEQDASVTYFELFTNFLVFSHLLPPVRVRGEAATWISRSTVQGQSFPVTVLQIFCWRLRCLDFRWGSLALECRCSVLTDARSLSMYSHGYHTTC